MRVYVDIDKFEANNIQELYVIAITKDRRAMKVGGDMMVWWTECKEESEIKNETDN